MFVDGVLAQEIWPTATNVWHMLKSMLFTTVLVAQSVLDVIIYYSPITPREAKGLSSTILMVFCRLSFVSTKFGALTAEGGGFSEMKRAFFGALDVLAFNSNDRDRTGDESCIKLIIDLSCELSSKSISWINLRLLTPTCRHRALTWYKTSHLAWSCCVFLGMH